MPSCQDDREQNTGLAQNLDWKWSNIHLVTLDLSLKFAVLDDVGTVSCSTGNGTNGPT